MLDTIQARLNLEVAAVKHIDVLREYVLAEVAKYLKELGLDADTAYINRDEVETLIDRASDRLADGIRDEYVKAEDMSDAIEDYSSRIDNLEQKLDKLIDLLSDMKVNIGEYL